MKGVFLSAQHDDIVQAVLCELYLLRLASVVTPEAAQLYPCTVLGGEGNSSPRCAHLQRRALCLVCLSGPERFTRAAKSLAPESPVGAFPSLGVKSGREMPALAFLPGRLKTAARVQLGN